MGVRLNKVKAEWKAFRGELQHGSKRGFFHDYIDLWVEMNRLMAYTKGHIEAFLWPLFLGALIGAMLPDAPRAPTNDEISAWCAMQGSCDIPMPPVIE